VRRRSGAEAFVDAGRPREGQPAVSFSVSTIFANSTRLRARGGQDLTDVLLDRVRLDLQDRRDLIVGVAVGDQFAQLPLARCEPAAPGPLRTAGQRLREDRQLPGEQTQACEAFADDFLALVVEDADHRVCVVRQTQVQH